MNINEIGRLTAKYNKLLETILQEELFDDLLTESESVDRNKVIELIKSNNLQTTPNEFYQSINQSKHKGMLTDYTLSDFNNMKLFKVPGYNIGYAIKRNGKDFEIVAVHNNEADIKGIGEILMQSAVNNGGNILDHFGSDKLNDLYSKMGFKKYHEEPYNKDYDEDGSFKKTYGELPVIYRRK